ncbi:SDR family NAD(P)-dependent oxidoreductase [Dietzia sp. CH92]|uniref:SDR family NAD(P)-dependent oxidoreductase n=1 Tax=Dietzia sp. CH92 TaxID=3051823 RepID=UPI0028D331B4|nr:SDR family NAD(P)-dependent oxidoreductase [Dietzia sp. CH92]
MSEYEPPASRSVTELVDAADQITQITQRFRLVGQHVVVLGGGRGIGRHTAHALAHMGASVTVVDAERDRANEVAEEIGPSARAAVVDATNDRDMGALVADLGRVDGVVDVIGMARYRPLLELSDSDWDSAHNLVLRHAWLTTRHFGQTLADQAAGSLTFVASVSGLGTAPGHAAYGAYKAALTSLVRTAALELGPAGVRVNAVAPGFTLTPRMREVLDEAQLANARAAEPLPRWTTPSDVAAGISFLVSDLAAAVTGQVLVMDGGATVTYPYRLQGLNNPEES